VPSGSTALTNFKILLPVDSAYEIAGFPLTVFNEIFDAKGFPTDSIDICADHVEPSVSRALTYFSFSLL
jgi:hypothetical protein